MPSLICPLALSTLLMCLALFAHAFDDTDPLIQYSGAWVRNPNGTNPLNWGNSITYSDVPGATATVVFTGIGVTVVGAFERTGTFIMKSQYVVDGGTPFIFQPASEVGPPQYRQLFYDSGALPEGKHTLVITNLGKEFWLDEINTKTAPTSTTSISQSQSTSLLTTPSSSSQPTPATSVGGTPSSPLSPNAPLTTVTAGPLDTQQSSTNAAPSAPDSTHPTTASNLSSVGSSTGSTTSVTPPNTQQTAGEHPVVDRTSSHIGAIVGETAAGLGVLLLALCAFWWFRHRQRTNRFELGPETITTFLDTYETQPVSPASGGYISGKRRRSGSPPWPSTIVSPTSGSSTGQETFAAYSRGGITQYGLYPPPEALTSHGTSGTARRRSLDGGVRIAGGLPGEDMDEMRSEASTLPPLYCVDPRGGRI